MTHILRTAGLVVPADVLLERLWWAEGFPEGMGIEGVATGWIVTKAELVGGDLLVQIQRKQVPRDPGTG